ncbi:putative thiamine transport system substrate-binding protein [Thioclava sp. ES.031]|uniref:ABC transporter substrate-binding protein n=1 Tax=Thioclava sp. ES.031 TaxID=1798203 RepID=UPI000BFA9486|nr:ABC transporter substrate-binding protein [Thioclava sp. ES.031]PFG61660.1 putative thiamine transport system substrate-binding protein [Thioclava sp. ES.031]
MRNLLAAPVLAASFALPLASPAFADWAQTEAEAKGQTVYFNAWGGDPRTNAFIDWVSDQMQEKYGVTVEQVKLSDTAEAVSRVQAEKAAGKDEGGAVDLIWINGPNFLAMKEAGLLHGPFVSDLPNAKYLDLSEGSAATTDFTVPTEGYESPWRLAKFAFAYDAERVSDPPKDMAGLLDWAKAHPGRFTHPNPSNFMGASFLKQALVELAPDPAALAQPVTDEAYAKETAPLWAWYDALRPLMRREGKSFPENESVQAQLLADGEVDFAMFFDPAAPAAMIEQGVLPPSVRVWVPEGGTIGNISYVAIPYNAAHQAGAELVANFLLDPATQAHMQDIRVLGSFSVLDPAKLDADAKQAFADLPTAPALPTLDDLGPTLPEPHPSWMTKLTEDWAQRYTK